uniref:hypothetical protein 8 n=1 Tax=Moniliophthora perniciosa TaxID=153609 RepID=UPI0000242341|nr:hypothetical protein 8 [Moniliophthora perniciosa]AAQ74298.1 hypothetical protein 8 [Moniliophthora perniciosa]
MKDNLSPLYLVMFGRSYDSNVHQFGIHLISSVFRPIISADGLKSKLKNFGLFLDKYPHILSKLSHNDQFIVVRINCSDDMSYLLDKSQYPVPLFTELKHSDLLKLYPNMSNLNLPSDNFRVEVIHYSKSLIEFRLSLSSFSRVSISFKKFYWIYNRFS